MENSSTVLFETPKNVEKTIQKQKIFSIVGKVLIYIFLILVAISTLFPFYWMLNTSFKTMDEYLRLYPTFFPENFVVSNYASAVQVKNFVNNLSNTFIVAFVSTALSMVIIVLAAFAFARLEFKGKDILFTALLATMMVPGELFTITNFATVSSLNWNNTYVVLIVPFLVSVFYIYLLRNAFKQIPDSLYYAAKVDGVGDFKYLTKVMIPLASPTIISITILKVMGSWNSYIWPRLVNSDKSFQLVSNWLTSSFTNVELNMTDYPMKMAGVVIVSLPLLIIFIFFRKYIMKGVSKSGIKG